MPKRGEKKPKRAEKRRKEAEKRREEAESFVRKEIEKSQSIDRKSVYKDDDYDPLSNVLPGSPTYDIIRQLQEENRLAEKIIYHNKITV